MNIAVLIKMVPDTESKLEVNDGTLSDQNFKYMVNPYDEFAVEQAVQFKEAEGGKVTLLSLFSEDNSIDTDLRKMLAIGADEIIVLRQNGYQGDKPLANAKILSDAIKELEIDLVLCGIQGIDYYQAATGTMVAQMLGMPNISGVTKIELSDLSPYSIGQLLSLWENKTIFNSIFWNTNAFDQWGVELGKELAKGLEIFLATGSESKDLNASTQNLVKVAKTMQ